MVTDEQESSPQSYIVSLHNRESHLVGIEGVVIDRHLHAQTSAKLAQEERELLCFATNLHND